MNNTHSSMPAGENVVPNANTRLKNFLGDAQLLLSRCTKLLVAKNHDYAADTDVFSNFKFAGDAAGVSPAQALLVLMGVKVSRLSQLVGNGKVPLNEKIEDTIIDLINYALLLHGVLDEKAPPRMSVSSTFSEGLSGAVGCGGNKVQERTPPNEYYKKVSTSKTFYPGTTTGGNSEYYPSV